MSSSDLGSNPIRLNRGFTYLINEITVGPEEKAHVPALLAFLEAASFTAITEITVDEVKISPRCARWAVS